MKLITGDGKSRKVSIDGKVLSPRRSQKVRNHSPDGFNWGYGGSGPAQLALGILLEFTDEETARRLYQRFKFDVVARFPMGESWRFSARTVEEWIEAHREEGKQ